MIKKLFLAAVIITTLNAMEIADDDSFGSRALDGYIRRKNEVYSIVEQRVKTQQHLDVPIAQHDLSPLHYCAINDIHLPYTKKLLAAGAKPFLTDDWGKTPLHRATENESLLTIKELVATEKCGINYVTITFDFKTALHMICEPWHDTHNDLVKAVKRFQITRLLLAHNAKSNARNFCQETPIFSLITTEFKHFSSEINTQATEKERAFFLKQRKDLIKLLIEYNANIWLSDSMQQTAMLNAMKTNNQLLIQLAHYAQKAYARYHLLVCRKILQKEAPHSLLATLHKDLINCIAQYF